MGKIEYLNVWKFRVFCNGKFMGKFEETTIDIACPYFYHVQTNISIRILGKLCANLFVVRIPHYKAMIVHKERKSGVS
jgi:hypothetical protein